MKPITPETLKAFFSHPSRNKIEKEAGLRASAISDAIRGVRELTEEHIEKLKPVLKKYGWI